MIKINATLHCHGPWTDIATGKYDIEHFPRNIEKVSDLAISHGLGLVGLTDISGKSIRKYYGGLVDNAKLDRYEKVFESQISIGLKRKEDGKRIDFGRGIEVLSNDSHVLILGTDKDIYGVKPLEEVLYESKENNNATIIADHPCYTIKYGKGIGEERVRKFKQEGLIDGLEENANIAWVLEKIGHYNQKAIKLGKELNLPVIANCDGNTADDMGIMSTEYEIPKDSEDRFKDVLKLIKEAKFNDKRIKRMGKVKPFISLPSHLFKGLYSIYRGKKGWIKEGLPAC